jgi:hypothetical protein
MPETLLSTSEVLLFGRLLEDLNIATPHPGVDKGRGYNKLLANQLQPDARLARIYGFSFEGAYQDLPAPTIFLVHGEGVSATRWMEDKEGGEVIDADAPGRLASRAPNEPDLSGTASADFQIADDIRVWPYDKSDYSIRLDATTGPLEQILLDMFYEVEMPMLSGGRVAGGRVAGGRVAGGRVAGGRVAGGRVAGGRVRGGRVGDSGE